VLTATKPQHVAAAATAAAGLAALLLLLLLLLLRLTAAVASQRPRNVAGGVPTQQNNKNLCDNAKVAVNAGATLLLKVSLHLQATKLFKEEGGVLAAPRMYTLNVSVCRTAFL
jgi:hypothetical protein